MAFETFTIMIEGEETSDIYQDLMSLEVELDDELAAMFRLRLAMGQEPDGTWDYLDDARFRVWKHVVITAGLESGAEELISGYITHVRPNFDPDVTRCNLEIWGLDGSIRMDREEKLKDWPNKKDSDIAAEIFNLYGFTPETEDSTVIHDEIISTIIQRESDMQFLKRLALRNGFECYVEGNTGYFRSPRFDAPPQPVLAVHFGEETNVRRFALEVNGLVPTDVAMLQLDRTTKAVLDVTVDTSRQTALGATDATGILATGIDPGLVFVAETVTTGNPEMTALAQGLYDESAWFVTAEGEINGNDYGHVLKTRGTVTIKGVGESYSGIYYVTHVTHSFTPDGYTQHFRVKRNGIGLTGNEDFSAGTGDLS